MPPACRRDAYLIRKREERKRKAAEKEKADKEKAEKAERGETDKADEPDAKRAKADDSADVSAAKPADKVDEKPAAAAAPEAANSDKAAAADAKPAALSAADATMSDAKPAGEAKEGEAKEAKDGEVKEGEEKKEEKSPRKPDVLIQAPHKLLVACRCAAGSQTNPKAASWMGGCKLLAVTAQLAAEFLGIDHWCLRWRRLVYVPPASNILVHVVARRFFDPTGCGYFRTTDLRRLLHALGTGACHRRIQVRGGRRLLTFAWCSTSTADVC